jgi:hypothetical protein
MSANGFCAPISHFSRFLQDPSPITLPPPGRMKTMSMLEMRTNKAERLAMHREAIRHRDAFPNLVRLADNLLLQASLESATTAVEDVATLLTDAGKARGVFHCQLLFSNSAEGILFLPTHEEFEVAMVHRAEAVIAVRASLV